MSRVDLETFWLRGLMVGVATLVFSEKWASGAQLIITLRLAWLIVYWQPHLVGWVNHARTGISFWHSILVRNVLFKNLLGTWFISRVLESMVQSCHSLA
jgi:hypothetical protein